MTTKAPAKKPGLAEVLQVLERLHGLPLTAERPEDPLVDHLLVGVLGLRAGLEKGRAAVRALSEAFHDFNEVRVSPLFELAEILEPYVGKEQSRAAAWDARMALQDVFDGTHGLDLEPLRGRDPDDQRSFLKDLPNTPGGPSSVVFQIALGEDRLALGPREQHLLRRLGLLPSGSQVQRVRASLEKVVPPGGRARFTWITGASAHMYEKGDLDLEHPFCRLLVACRAKELGEREREKKREEARRKAEEKRRLVEEAKRKRLEEIQRKKREKDEAKRLAKEKKESDRRARVAEQKAQRAAKAAAAVAKKKAAAAAKKAAAKKKQKAEKAKKRRR